jgi:hypothetical protein
MKGCAALTLVLIACSSDPTGGTRAGAMGGSSGTSAGTGGSGGLEVSNAGSSGASSGGNAGAGASSGAAGTEPMIPAPNVDSILASGCATATVESRLVPMHVLFVLDRSGSMLCNPPPTTDSELCEADPMRMDAAAPSKWEIVEDALVETLGTLPTDVSVGISYFSNDDACGVHPTPSVAIRPLATGQLSAIETSLAGVTPGGGTPIVGATVLAYQHMHTMALDGELRGNKFVVLLTDGQQSEQCGDAQCSTADECTALLVEDEATKARMPGVDIRTFVIGAPGSEPARNMLSQLAVSGGTAPEGCDAGAGECHFDMTRETDFAGALSTALVEITGRAATCELPLPQADEAIDLERVNVIYSPGSGSDATLIVQDARSACDAGADGWQYSADHTKIQLCGPICETVRADQGSRVDVVFGCPVRGPD